MSDFTSVIISTANVTAYATSGDPVRKYYFGFQPGGLNTLSAQLVTEAHNQGWETGGGIWTWFELALLTKSLRTGDDATPYIRKDSSGNLLTWKSHDVPLDSKWNTQVGPVFGPDSPLFKNLQSGDVVGVIAFAQYSGWKLDARRGTLTVQGNS